MAAAPEAAASRVPHLAWRNSARWCWKAGNFFPHKHQKILLNLFDLEAITVDDVMTPRNQIEAIDIDGPLDELGGRSRPVTTPGCRHIVDSLDEIVGIIHVRKILNLGAERYPRETLSRVLRDPYFIPAGTPLLAQLQHFQEEEERWAWWWTSTGSSWG